jgi:hypothetical protein
MLNIQNIESELNQLADKSTINSFWELVESIDVNDSASNIKSALKRELSPQQSRDFSKLFGHICDAVHEYINENGDNSGEMNSCARYVLSEGYTGLVGFTKEQFESSEFASPEVDFYSDVFPSSDDYWSY